jgi:hypothetical protein
MMMHAGTQKLHVRDDYIHWLHVGLHKAVPKMLLCLQRLVFGSQQHPGDAAAGTRQASKAVQQLGHPAARRRDLQPTAGRSLLAAADEGDGSSWQAAFEGAAADLAQLHGAGSTAGVQDGGSKPSEQQLLTDVITSHKAVGSLPQQLPQLSYCLLLNNSLCTATVNMTGRGSAAGGEHEDRPGGFMLVVYNPLSWPTRQGLRLPVAGGRSYTVTGEGAWGVSQPNPHSLVQATCGCCAQVQAKLRCHRSCCRCRRASKSPGRRTT